MSRTAVLLLVTTWMSLANVMPPAHRASVGVPGSPIPESADFATLVLRDPWDMNQYSDVSQYLNESGQRYLVANPAVASGEFTGQSVGDAISGNAYFFPLFPGYETAMLIGKVGHRYPIDSSVYRCLYIAMRVDSGAPNQLGPDQFRVFWFADDTLNSPGSVWGVSNGIQIYPGSGTPPHYYSIYKVDLATVGHIGAAWTDRSTWQGLRIDPTINAGVTFAVDWVRLTTCSANSQTVTWTPDNSISAAWVKASGTTRWVRVATGLNGSSGSAVIDVQGIPPGSYVVGLGTTTTCCASNAISTAQMVIDSTPIVEFVSPSFFSGQDYAGQAGIPWDFNSASDVTQAANVTYAINSGLLETTVPSGPLPAGVDAQFFLNTPQAIQPGTFRYLSYHMSAEWKAPWQNTPHGMIVRIIWGIQGVSGAPGNRCWFVSQDIPFDIGWQTYWIDLGDPFNGRPELTSGYDCPSPTPNWTNSPPVLDFRFDPDENITVGSDHVTGGGSFHHQVDWVRLTAPASVARGAPYRIQLHINRSISQIAYYYTTNRSNPTQAIARSYSLDQPVIGNRRIFLPLLQAPSTSTDMGGLPTANTTFMWDTSGVALNSYYICVRVTGGGNTATYCSETPVSVR